MRKSVLWMVLMFSVSAIPVVRAEKLDDFKEAASKKGCESIPYSDLQSDCKSQQSEVKGWCDGGRGPVTCEIGVTADLQSKLDKAKSRRSELQDKRRDLDDKRSHSSDDTEKSDLTSQIEALDKALEEVSKQIDDLRAELEKRKDIVEKSIYNLNKCIDYRHAVMNIFGYALDKVRGESDPDLKTYVDQLVAKYQKSKEGHEEQIHNKENSRETCEKERPSS